MNIKRAHPEIKKSRLENEVILAVVSLYLLLSGALLAIHHLQPPDTETQTSSTSPAHREFGVAAGDASSAPALALTLTEAHSILTRAGFQEIRGIRAGGAGFQATAIKEGKTWEVEVDSATGQITRTLKPAR